ncbi:M28 family metallopeptidase [Streptomyces sodiiphilus]|uniref:M28 family metallopeptidase n=1 Tax=Streptomyces sodiiphilus TaxID=226217 RepID=A0ABN2PPM4_9ACTN
MHPPLRTSRRAIAVAATAALALPLLVTAPAVAQAATPAAQAATQHKDAKKGEKLARTLVKRTSAQGAMRHLYAFQRIADANDGNRAAGTRGHEWSARYAGGLLQAAGYDVTYQYFDFLYREAVAENMRQLTPEERDIGIHLMSYTASTPEGGIEAALAHVPVDETNGTGCAPEDFVADDMAGKIALVMRGGCTFAQKQQNAAAAGAVGAVIYNNVPGELNGTLGEAGAGLVPTGGISQEDGQALAATLEGGQEVTVNLEIIEFSETRRTPNVLAETRGGDAGNVVMLGGHLDSVLEGPGINDNGSGSAGVLEAALQLARADKKGSHTNKVRFALWSAEELGLLGAHHYVDNLTEEERDSIALYLNFDMIASPNYGLFVYDGDGSEGLSEPGPEGSAQIEHDINTFMRSQGHEPRPTAFNGRSDYGPFIAVDIPAGGTFTGAEGVKTEQQAALWGGTAGVAFDACYHDACDDINNLSRKALDINVKVIANALGRYAWDTSGLTRPVPAEPKHGDTADSGGLHDHHDTH